MNKPENIEIKGKTTNTQQHNKMNNNCTHCII